MAQTKGVSLKRGRLTKRNAAKRRKRAMAPERARVAAELTARLVRLGIGGVV